MRQTIFVMSCRGKLIELRMLRNTYGAKKVRAAVEKRSKIIIKPPADAETDRMLNNLQGDQDKYIYAR